MKRELTRARKNERSVKKINEPIDLKTQSCATSNHNFIYHLHAFRFIQLHSAHSICILYLPRIYRYDILLPNIIASLRMQSIHRPTKICYKSTCDFFFHSENKRTFGTYICCWCESLHVALHSISSWIFTYRTKIIFPDSTAIWTLL